MADGMHALIDRFEKAFGLPFSILPSLPERLEPADEKNMLWRSRTVTSDNYLGIGPGTDLRSVPIGYFMVGFWGYGINSHAFYYCRKDALSMIFLRLGYGGYDMDNEEAAAQIRQFLPALFAFDAEVRARGAQFDALDTMGAGSYRVTEPDGTVTEYSGSLLQSADFSNLRRARP